MREQVVGVFSGEARAVEAATLLRAAGYGPRDLGLVARQHSPAPSTFAASRAASSPGRS